MAGPGSSRMLVDALVRRAQGAGGFAMVLARGADERGGIIVQLIDRGRPVGLVERMLDFDGRPRLMSIGPAKGRESEPVDAYLERRRGTDPDLWVIELDIAEGERFVAETMGDG